MATETDHRVAPALRTPQQTRPRDDRRAPERNLEAEDRSEHPEAGGSATRGTAMTGYVVIFEGDEQSGYSAYSPDLPGIVAAADTRRETEALMREAMIEHIAVLREVDQRVPEPSTDPDVVIISIPAA